MTPDWDHGGDYVEHPRDVVRIGTREHVGWGHNGDQSYRDSVASPFPAIRFKEDKTDYDIQLREKEKGDWHKMTMEEKKHLYRQSYCQTFQEMKHGNDGDWKIWVGAGLMWASLAAATNFFYNNFGKY